MKLDILCWAGLTLFTLLLLGMNQSYYARNTRPPTYDEAWYLETSVSLYDAATHADWGRFLYLYKTAFETKAPLISVLPLPFYLAFGRTHISALLVNSVFLVISNLCLFLLVRRLFSPETGLVAVIFYQTMPLAFGLSRTLMTEYGLATLVLAWIYLLVVSERLTRGAVNFALGVVLGLGLLMKILFPAFIAGPLLATWIRRRREPASPEAPESSFWLWRACARHPAAAIAIPALAVAGTWYVFNLRNVFRFAWSNAYGDIAAGYGSAGFAQRTIRLINEGPSVYYAAAALVAGLLALAAVRSRLKELAASETTWLLLGWLVPPLAAIALGRNLEIRFALPLLPILAIALAVSLFTLVREPGPRFAVILLALAFPLRMFAALSLPESGKEPLHPVHLGPFTLLDRNLGAAHPPDAEGRWNQERILEALDRIDPPGRNPRYVVVGVEHPYLNANLLSYINTWRQGNWRLTSLGYAETSTDRAAERLLRLDTRFLIMSDGFHSRDLPAFLNRINGEVQGRLDRGELPFRPRAQVELGDGVRARIYEKLAPWTRFLPGEQFDPPTRAAPVDFYGGARFLGFDWKRVNPEEGQITYYWTTHNRPTEDFRIHTVFRRGTQILLREDHYAAAGRFPFFRWPVGEVVKEAQTFLLPAGAPPIELELWLEVWNSGIRTQVLSPPEWIHESIVRLRLEE